MLVARYNMANRWNSSLAVPQEAYRVLLTDTPEEFVAKQSIVAPLDLKDRPALESREAGLAQWAKARVRKARLPLLGEGAAKEVVADVEPLPTWIRLLANFPVEGKMMIDHYLLTVEKGALAPELKAQIAWVTAREDRAWYALDQAAR